MEHKFLSSSVPVEALICGSEAVVHFIAPQNKTILYQVGNMLHRMKLRSNWPDLYIHKKRGSFDAISVHNLFNRQLPWVIFQWFLEQAKLCWITHEPKGTNIPAETVETCWRENWAVVIFGLAYVFFRTLSISVSVRGSVFISLPK